MNALIRAAATLLIAVSLADAATLMIPTIDSRSNYVNSLIIVSNRLTPQSVSPYVVLGTVIRTYPTNGYAYASNLVASSYDIYFTSLGQRMRIEVPETNGLVNAQALASSGLTTYTWTNPIPYFIAAGTNVVIVTNGTTYTIHGTGGVDASTVNAIIATNATVAAKQAGSANLTNWSAITTASKVGSSSGNATNTIFHGTMQFYAPDESAYFEMSAEDSTGNAVFERGASFGDSVSASSFTGAVHGTNITDSTINSNKLDAATLAILGGVNETTVNSIIATNSTVSAKIANSSGVGTNTTLYSPTVETELLVNGGLNFNENLTVTESGGALVVPGTVNSYSLTSTGATLYGTTTLGDVSVGSNVEISGTLKAQGQVGPLSGEAWYIDLDGDALFKDVQANGTVYADNLRAGNVVYVGGVTADFPALKSGSPILKVRLADDSADADLTAAAGTFSGAITGSAATNTMTGALVLGQGYVDQIDIAQLNATNMAVSGDVTVTGTLAGNAGSLSNAVDIIAGSGVTVTTNANKRSFTLAITTPAVASSSGNATNTVFHGTMQFYASDESAYFEMSAEDSTGNAVFERGASFGDSVVAGGFTGNGSGITNIQPSGVAAGTFSGTLLSSASSIDAPANNELATAGWVRQQFDGAGVSYYATPYAASGITNADIGYAVTNYIMATTPIPPYGIRTINDPTNGQYFGAWTTTNRFLRINAGAVINAYMSVGTDGTGTTGPQVKMEIYISYDGTNWLGDWNSESFYIPEGSTNLHSALVANPTYVATNATGFYVRGLAKMVTQTDPLTSDVTIHYGTNYASHLSLSGASTSSGDVFAAANNVFTGSNTFSGAVTLTGGTRYGTNLADVTVIDISKNYAFVTTNNNISFTGLSGVSASGVLVDWCARVITNTSGAAKTITFPAAWIDTATGTNGSAVTYYWTNQCWISVARYPGAGTNFSFKGGSR